jgi:hypothetical protein
MSDTAQTPDVHTPTKSVWEDFVDIYFAPSQVFARRIDGRYGLALLVLTIVLAILVVPGQAAIAPALEADMQRAIEGMGADAQASAASFNPSGGLAMVFGVVGILVTTPIAAFITGLVVWGASRIFSAAFPVGVAVMIATYAAFPKVLQSVAMIVQGQFLIPDSMSALSVGPARFVDVQEASPVLLGLLTRLDLFTLWGTLLIAIGLYVAGRMPKGSAITVAAIAWAVAVLPTLIGSLFSTLIG